jgi:hypothetical protein
MMRAVLITGLLVMMGCGDDGGDVELEPVEPVVPDAAAAVHDAGTTRDARVSLPVDAAMPADAGKVPAPPQCEIGYVTGTPDVWACSTPAELAAHGCTAVMALDARGSDVLDVPASTLDGARYAIVYTTPGRVTMYLCSDAPPATDWQCTAHRLAECTQDPNTGSAQCGPTIHELAPLPTRHIICAVEPT